MNFEKTKFSGYNGLEYLKEMLTRRLKRQYQVCRSWKVFHLPFSYLFSMLYKSDKLDSVLLDKMCMLMKEYEKDMDAPPAPEPAKEYRIWVIWWQGEEHMPELIKACYHSLLRNARYEVVLITRENVEEWVQIPASIKKSFENGDITMTQLSEYIRFTLLCDRGGLYLDASIYVLKEMKDYSQYESYCGPSFLQGSNRVNDPRYYLLKHMYEEHFKRYSIILDYFQIDYMLKGVEKLYGELLNGSVGSADNPGRFDLLEKLDQPFDLNIWEQIRQDNEVQKLSQKRKYHIRTKQGDVTFAGYLLDKEGLGT